MADHCELVAEMPALEQMGTQERQKQAKKRRLQQLKKWGQREKEWISKEKQLNKRLSNALHEENNGLNLKQYTTYSSSHRSRKKLANGNSNNNKLNNTHLTNYSKSDYLNNNNNHQPNEPVIRVAPSGRVHFNVGVMLLEAAARNDFAEVKRLLMLGVSPDSVNHDGLTALHQCCIDASETMMQLLLDFGANVDAKDTEQWTPLHAACTCGHLNLVRILVEHGANLLAVNGDGNMPFDICEDDATLDYIESQMVERGITQEMIDYTRASLELNMLSQLKTLASSVNQSNHDDLHGGAAPTDLNAPTTETGVTPLHVAAANGYSQVVEFLISHGADVNVCDSDRWQPLHGAACWGNEQHIRVAELLVEAGASMEARTINDETVFDLCDNAELLERLNQLKDELESKQAAAAEAAASNANPLRRTQSRTNSRVHSVRRTSVRDKNQISRREAREEAMLRVDSGTLPTSATSNGSQVHISSNGNTDNITTPTSSIKDENQHQLDELDGGQPADVRLTCQQTDLDAHDDTCLNRKPDKEELSVCNPTDITTTGSGHFVKQSQQLNPMKPVANHNHNQDSLLDSLNNNNSLSIITNGDTKLLNSHESNKCYPRETKTTLDKSNRSLMQDSVNNNISSRMTKQNDTNSNTTTTTTTKSNCDSIALCPDGANAHPVVDLTVSATANNNTIYTLSNLKKQRSDLRMRTTTLGGKSNTVNNNNSSSDNDYMLNGVIGGSGRSDSPSVSFRKFRGAPSELIGGCEKESGHRCCILM